MVLVERVCNLTLTSECSRFRFFVVLSLIGCNCDLGCVDLFLVKQLQCDHDQTNFAHPAQH